MADSHDETAAGDGLVVVATYGPGTEAGAAIRLLSADGLSPSSRLVIPVRKLAHLSDVVVVVPAAEAARARELLAAFSEVEAPREFRSDELRAWEESVLARHEGKARRARRRVVIGIYVLVALVAVALVAGLLAAR